MQALMNILSAHWLAFVGILGALATLVVGVGQGVSVRQRTKRFDVGADVDGSNFSPAQVARLWEYALHEDTIFHERQNFFLVFESVMLGVFGTLYSRNLPDAIVLQTLAVLALCITLVWLYAQARQKYILDYLSVLMRKMAPEYDIIVKRRERWPVSVSWLLAYAFPMLVTLVWVALLIMLDRLK